MNIKIFLFIYAVVYISWFLINKAFGGRPDKYLREKIWNIFETQYGIVVPDELKANPVKYMLADLKDMFHKKKGGD